ncbi:MAG: Trp family transcriptional regulator [Minisyncoccia bacterium]|jgi:uncharacterized protein YerC
MKIQTRKLKEADKQKSSKALDALFFVLADLGDRQEINKLMSQLLTESERLMIGRRILIAQMLLNDVQFEKIIKELGVGADTIMRVYRWLESEEINVKKIIEKIGKKGETKRHDQSGYISHDPFSFSGIKRRYPGHFALFDLIDKLKK